MKKQKLPNKTQVFSDTDQKRKGSKKVKLATSTEKYKHKNHWLSEEDDEYVPPLKKKKRK